MFWVTLLSIFGSVAVCVNRERHRLLVPWVVAVIAIVEMFFLFLMVIHNNPFDTFVTETHTTGQGLNPLLQNFYMAIHPPMLYLGFVGMTIPYAFGMAALITGQLDDSWLRAVRRWTMIALALPDVRPDARRCSGRTRRSAGAATGAGTRSRTRRCCRGSRPPRSCTR